MTQKRKEVYEFLLNLAKELSEKKLGGLFVIADKKNLKGIYEPLYPQIIGGKNNIFQKGTRELILKLAELDGAFLIGDDGQIVAFGARINKSSALKGYGTKHAAAKGITSYIKNCSAILVSEESNTIKIFKNGEVVLDLGNEKLKNTTINNIISFLTDNDTTLLATAGVSAAVMGFLPAVVVSGTYLAIKTASNVIKNGIKK